MAKRDYAANFLKEGMFLHEISKEMNVSFQTIARYMKMLVAEGKVTASEIFYGIHPTHRESLEVILSENKGKNCKEYYSHALNNDITWDEANLYFALRDIKISMGDMYEKIYHIEISLHNYVRKILEKYYGDNEKGWWRKGVPLNIRKICVQIREEDPEACDCPYSYTTFIHLEDIISKNWNLFIDELPKHLLKRKSILSESLIKLNRIRNCVMHPAKGKILNKEDFDFVNSFYLSLGDVISSNTNFRSVQWGYR